MEVLFFLNNLQFFCSTKNCILIIIKRGWQYKAGRQRFTPYQSEYPIRFEFFRYVYMLATDSKTFIKFIYIQNSIRAKFLGKLFIQCRYE